MGMMGRLRRFLSDESGVSAIEYALIAALVAVAIVGAIDILGQEVNDAFWSVSSDVATVASGLGGG